MYEYHFYGRGDVCCPHIRDVIAESPTSLTFDGYFHLEDSMFSRERPVRRLVLRYDYAAKFQELLHIAIHTKRRGKDTSVYGPVGEEDEEDYGEGCGICFFPTEEIELLFDVLEVVASKERMDEIMLEIEGAEEALQKESDVVRSRREYEEWQRDVERYRSTPYILAPTATLVGTTPTSSDSPVSAVITSPGYA